MLKKMLGAILVAMLALTVLPAGAVETVHTLSIDDEDNTDAEYTSDVFAGVAPTFFAGEYTCGDTGDNCEYLLVEITGLTDEEIAAAVAAGTEADLRDRVNYKIGITNYSVPVSDLDIIVYASDADGTKGPELGRVGDLDTDPSEEFSGSFTATATAPTGYFLLEVVFFAGAGTYDAYANAR